jgi:hypothetical protein
MNRRIMLAVAPLLLGVGGCGYNQIQQLDETAAQAKQQISVQLQRRADLVPNLVNTVKGYATHEEGLYAGGNGPGGSGRCDQTGDPQRATANGLCRSARDCSRSRRPIRSSRQTRFCVFRMADRTGIGCDFAKRL